MLQGAPGVHWEKRVLVLVARPVHRLVAPLQLRLRCPIQWHPRLLRHP